MNEAISGDQDLRLGLIGVWISVGIAVSLRERQRASVPTQERGRV